MVPAAEVRRFPTAYPPRVSRGPPAGRRWLQGEASGDAKEKRSRCLTASAPSSRGDTIRTCDLLHPIQVRYQAALRPVVWLSIGGGARGVGISSPADDGSIANPPGNGKTPRRGSGWLSWQLGTEGFGIAARRSAGAWSGTRPSAGEARQMRKSARSAHAWVRGVLGITGSRAVRQKRTGRRFRPEDRCSNRDSGDRVSAPRRESRRGRRASG